MHGEGASCPAISGARSHLTQKLWLSVLLGSVSGQHDARMQHFDDVEITLPYQSSLACPCVPDLGAAEPLLHALHAV